MALEGSVMAHLQLASSVAEAGLQREWVHRTNKTVGDWWLSMGHVGQVVEEATMLRGMARRDGASTICEVCSA